MKIYFRINKPQPDAKCSEHPFRPAAFEMNLDVYGQAINRRACMKCLCRHFNLQVYFSVQEGLELPGGLRHGISNVADAGLQVR
jgi:hypothetical protein